MQRKVKVSSLNLNSSSMQSESKSRKINFQNENSTIKIKQDPDQSKPSTSKEGEQPEASTSLFEVIKMSEEDEPLFRTKLPSIEQLNKFFPNQKVSVNSLKLSILMVQ